MSKRGVVNLSFGMIFSIVMIIIFLTFAFYAIQKFLSIQNTAQAGKFVNDLQNDIDRMWKSSQGEQEQEYTIQGKVRYICFVDYEFSKRGEKENFYDELNQVYYGEENLFFYPVGSGEGFDSAALRHVDIEKTTEIDNPLCFENINGKISFTIKKDFNEALVTISE
ncbi:hypothetical protein HYT25_03510 [Candidatus Pacearchaeota archaeon]|nr:hypothetical protein [Candidatus Pacearchaeota archaeon]